MLRLEDLLTTTRRLFTLAALASLLAFPARASGPGELKFDDNRFEVIEEAGLAVITVERSSGEDGAVTVDYHTTTGTATEGLDYADVAGTLTWADDDGSDRVFTLPIFDDAEAEGEEIIQLVLSNPTGGAALDGQHSVSVLVIRASDGGDDEADSDDGEDSDDADSDDGEDSDDDEADSDDGEDSDDDGEDSDDGDSDGEDSDGEDSDGEDSDGEDSDSQTDNPAGFFKFDEESFEVLEDAGVAIVVVERSMGEDGEASVDYSTGGGTAADGEDFTGVSGTLTWFAGDGIDKTFAVPILDDDLAEGGESFDLTLANPTGGAELHPTRSTSVVRILANDGGTGGDDGNGDDGNGDDGNGNGNSAGVLKFGSGTFQAIEGSGIATITVERSKGETGAVSVDYATFDGSAFDGIDYSGVAGTLSWADGDGSNKTLMIPITDDAEAEGNETVDLLLMNPTGGAVLDPQRDAAVLTVVDDDSGSCTPSDQTLCLLGGRFKAEATWRTVDAATGPGRPVSLSDQSGLIWFFDPANVEVLLKVLDGCSFNGSYWVFFAATTDLELLDVTVTDTATGQSRTYSNPQGRAAEPVQDVTTFTGCS